MTHLLRRSEVVHATNNGAPNRSASAIVAGVALPLAVVGVALIVRRKAANVGWWLLGGAVALAVYRFGEAAIAFASPAPLGFRDYHFPGVGAVAVVGRTSGFVCAVSIAVGVAVSLGNDRLDQRSRLVLRVGCAGVALIALGFATSPDHIVSSFDSVVDSPLALPNFDAAAITLRLVGELTCVAVFGLALFGTYERLRDCGEAARASMGVLGGAVATTLLVAAVGFVGGVDSLSPLAAILAAVVLPVVLGRTAERVADETPQRVAASVAAVPEGEGTFELLSTRVIAVARLVSALWALALFSGFSESFDGPLPMVLLVAATLTAVVATVGAMLRLRLDWRVQSVAEIAIAGSLLLADGAVSHNGHLFSGASSLGGPWPTVVVAAAGASGGAVVGATAGALVGIARVAGVIASGAPVFAAQGQSLAGGVVALIAVGLATGVLLTALRDAERRIASARAREAVARRLHDGVLQALAIVRRRAKDAELVALVDDADRDLRAFLDFGDATGEVDLERTVRQAVDDCERRYGLDVQFVVDELPRRVSPEMVVAVAGAVSEALANVSKHSGVTSATVFAGCDADGRHYVSVTDRGKGFDEDKSRAGRGISQSVEGRMHEVNGSASIRALAGGGTQVMLWLP
jgi:signal transduction histidine kinase